MKLVFRSCGYLPFLLALMPVWAADSFLQGVVQTEKPEEIQLVVLGMDCEGCSREVQEALEKIPGVIQARVDYKAEKAVATVRPGTSIDSLKEALKTEGFIGLLPNEDRTPYEPLPEAIRTSLDIRTISRGEKIRVKDHLVSNKITLFDYYADWCAPCHILDAMLQRLLQRYPEVALRRVNISEWDSSAARQATKDFKLPGLPFVRLLNDKGKVLGEVHGLKIDEIEAVVKGAIRKR